jgi:hypothetical protein
MRVSQAPEVTQALDKAEEYGLYAALAESAEDRNYYQRLRDKWIDIADSWRLIAEFDTKH